jgi:predicted TIM-barrel fold metal-dependent hydrolase
VLASRDHLLAENPKLRVVGAHFGSMESDVDLVAQRLDRYPNLAVDTAVRVPHLTIQPRAKVRGVPH